MMRNLICLQDGTIDLIPHRFSRIENSSHQLQSNFEQQERRKTKFLMK
jgi:hypothetical protein